MNFPQELIKSVALGLFKAAHAPLGSSSMFNFKCLKLVDESTS